MTLLESILIACAIIWTLLRVVRFIEIAVSSSRRIDADENAIKSTGGDADDGNVENSMEYSNPGQKRPLPYKDQLTWKGSDYD